MVCSTWLGPYEFWATYKIVWLWAQCHPLNNVFVLNFNFFSCRVCVILINERDRIMINGAGQFSIICGVIKLPIALPQVLTPVQNDNSTALIRRFDNNVYIFT